MNELFKLLREYDGSLEYSKEYDAFYVKVRHMGGFYTGFDALAGVEMEQPDGAIFILPCVASMRKEIEREEAL